MAFGYAFSALLMVPKFAAKALSASAQQIGELQAAPVVAAIIVAPLCGRWIDRGGWRPALLLGSALIALGTTGFGAVRELGTLAFALRAVQGVGNSLVIGGTGALVALIVPRANHGRAFGTVGAAALMMNAVGASVTEGLAERFGWGVAFEVAGAVVLLAFAFTLTLPAVSTLAPAHGAAAQLNGNSLLRWLVYYGSFASGIGFAVLATFTQPFALSLGAERVSMLFVGYTLTALIVRFGLGGLADRWGRRRAAAAALGVYALTALAAAALRPEWLFCLGLGFGAAHGLAWPALSALAVQHAPAGRSGSALVELSAVFGAGSMLAMWAGGALVGRFGYPLTFAVAAACVASGALTLGIRSGAARAPES
jgi:MFS family permease